VVVVGTNVVVVVVGAGNTGKSTKLVHTPKDLALMIVVPTGKLLEGNPASN
jgi:threonine synthase